MKKIVVENKPSYADEYSSAEEIAILLSQINDSENRSIAKAQIKSFLEGFISRGEFCNDDNNKTA